jgi:tetratricopeptide (TPR) repeat protein
LNLLANIRELKVPSRMSSFYYQGRDFDVESIAKQLRVRNILEGSIQGPVEELLISAQLIDTDSGYHVWSQSFAPRGTDMLTVRDEIARSVVESLKVALSIESQNRIMRRPTHSTDAYDYYLQALSYLRRPRAEQTLDNAEGLFRRALDFDPDYALAYAGLCNVYLGKYRLNRQTENVEPAEQSCTKALSLNPELSEVHVALGSLYRHTGQYEAAEREFQRVIVLNPKLETAYYGLAMTLKAQDRLGEAENIFRYAVNLEPGYWGTHLALGNYYLEYGRPAEAIPLFRRVTELNPEYALGYNSLGAALYNSGDLAGGEAAYLKSLDIAPSEFALSNMGSVYYNTGRFDSAVDMFTQAVEFTPNDYRNWGRLAFAQRFVPGLEKEAKQNFQTAVDIVTNTLEVNSNDWRALAYLASYYANVGEIDKSQSALDRALMLGPKDPHVHFFGAISKAALGDSEGALQFLEKAARLGYSTNAIASDPDFQAFRGDDRFKALLATG